MSLKYNTFFCFVEIPGRFAAGPGSAAGIGWERTAPGRDFCVAKYKML
jgi:hypothetical protein